MASTASSSSCVEARSPCRSHAPPSSRSSARCSPGLCRASLPLPRLHRWPRRLLKHRHLRRHHQLADLIKLVRRQRPTRCRHLHLLHCCWPPRARAPPGLQGSRRRPRNCHSGSRQRQLRTHRRGRWRWRRRHHRSPHRRKGVWTRTLSRLQQFARSPLLPPMEREGRPRRPPATSPLPRPPHGQPLPARVWGRRGSLTV
mmetsp:Transcript_93683/g.303326  ORF Transcript_93683/g.303326 Transcript_93683/m.303326 type:complete len:200 (+) Transcript_93683:1031-1630(+)